MSINKFGRVYKKGYDLQHFQSKFQKLYSASEEFKKWVINELNMHKKNSVDVQKVIQSSSKHEFETYRLNTLQSCKEMIESEMKILSEQLDEKDKKIQNAINSQLENSSKTFDLKVKNILSSFQENMLKIMQKQVNERISTLTTTNEGKISHIENNFNNQIKLIKNNSSNMNKQIEKKQDDWIKLIDKKIDVKFKMLESEILLAKQKVRFETVKDVFNSEEMVNLRDDVELLITRFITERGKDVLNFKTHKKV